MPETHTLHEAAPGVQVVTLNRPEAANALNTAMGRELLETWTKLGADPSLRAVILTGAGRFFFAGGDLKERNGMTDQQWAAQHRLFEDMHRAQLACPVPVIAAVNGAAMGGGTEMTIASDFAYASESAKFGLPEAGLGIMPGLGGSVLLSRAVGERRAIELLTTTRHFTPQEALEWGLVNAVTKPEDLMETALAAAARIAANAPLSVRALKRVVRASRTMETLDALKMEVVEYDRLFTTKDRHEGVGAFNEKRPASFKGE